jgi:hypothetical protein
LKPLRNKKKDKEREFVTKFLRLIKKNRGHIAEEIEAVRPRIRETSTMRNGDEIINI